MKCLALVQRSAAGSAPIPCPPHWPGKGHRLSPQVMWQMDPGLPASSSKSEAPSSAGPMLRLCVSEGVCGRDAEQLSLLWLPKRPAPSGVEQAWQSPLGSLLSQLTPLVNAPALHHVWQSWMLSGAGSDQGSQLPLGMSQYPSTRSWCLEDFLGSDLRGQQDWSGYEKQQSSLICIGCSR